MTNTYYVAGIPFTSYNSLAHHGIKGQKWGVRRFQNEDGSLTAEGAKRIRYNSKDARADLGFKEKGHLNTTQRHLVNNYKTYVNASVRQGNMGDKKAEYGKDPTKNYNRGIAFMKQAQTYKQMAKTYNSLTEGEQKKINRGVNAVNALGWFFGGGVGTGIAGVVNDSRLRKQLA